MCSFRFCSCGSVNDGDHDQASCKLALAEPCGQCLATTALLSRATVVRVASTNRPAAAAVRVLARPGALLPLGPLRLGPGQRGGLATGMTLGLSPLHTAARALVRDAPPLLDAARTLAAVAVAADVKRVKGETEQAGADIKRVEAKIEDVEAQLKVAQTPQDVAYLREEKKQLREEKGRLDDRKNKLLDKEKQLRDKENAGSCFDRNINRSNFFAAVEIRTPVVALHTLCIQIQSISPHLPLSPANAPTAPLPQFPGKRHRFSALLYSSFLYNVK